MTILRTARASCASRGFNVANTAMHEADTMSADQTTRESLSVAGGGSATSYRCRVIVSCNSGRTTSSSADASA